MRVPGHKLTLEHNGERSREESAWTATCSCGDFQESHSLKSGAQSEYRWHLQRVRNRLAAQEEAKRIHDQAREYLDAHPTSPSIDQIQARIEHEAWLMRTAQAVVNSLPSLRTFLREDIDVATAASEIAREIEDSINADAIEKAQLAATAMYLLKELVT